MSKNSDYDHRLKDRGVIHIDKRVLKSFERDWNGMNQGAREIVLGSGEMPKESGTIQGDMIVRCPVRVTFCTMVFYGGGIIYLFFCA